MELDCNETIAVAPASYCPIETRRRLVHRFTQDAFLLGLLTLPPHSIYDEQTTPKWRNWQTRQLQELVPVREWRFESSLRHC